MFKKRLFPVFFIFVAFLPSACNLQPTPENSNNPPTLTNPATPSSRPAQNDPLKEEPAPLVGALANFYNSRPGLDEPIASLSIAELGVFRARPSLVRVDAILMPEDSAGQPFANFKAFHDYLQQPGHEAWVKKIMVQMRLVIEGLDLHSQGYRWIFEQNSASTIPFHFRLLGGEKMTPGNVGNRVASITEEAYTSSSDFFKKADSVALIGFFNKVWQATEKTQASAGQVYRVSCDTGADAEQTTPHFQAEITLGDLAQLGPAASSEKPHREFKSRNIGEVLAHVDDKTLVVFDVDKTLAWVPGHLDGNDEGITAIYPAEGQNTIKMWHELLRLTTNDQTTMGAKYIALTARAAPAVIGSNDDILANLQQAGLLYSDQWIAGKGFAPIFAQGIYRNKVLYSAFSDKGKMLQEFLKQAKAVGYDFDKVIFFDDRKENVRKMLAAMTADPAIKSSINFYYHGRIHPKTGATYAELSLATKNAFADITPRQGWGWGCCENSTAVRFLQLPNTSHLGRSYGSQA